MLNTENPELIDAVGEGIRKKAARYFGIVLDEVRHVNVLTIDSELEEEERKRIQARLVDPVTQVSAFGTVVKDSDFDRALWIGLNPGAKDNAGEIAKEELIAVLGDKARGMNVYVSDYFTIKGKDLSDENIGTIAKGLLSNEFIQHFEGYSPGIWDNEEGVGRRTQEVKIRHRPHVSTIPYDELTVERLTQVNVDRSLSMNHRDIPIIVEYFQRKDVQEERKRMGLAGVTDLELEMIAQRRSDHCNHNTFNAMFRYRDMTTGDEEIINNLFEEHIKNPTKHIWKRLRPDVVSILWDNAGVAEFDEGHYYVITGETHNSPSNKEAYGGAITGIVGVYRDPMGTGRGAKLTHGFYGFAVGPHDDPGIFIADLHPRRLLEGVIEGVKDGGNKSGIPTPFGRIWFHKKNKGKSSVYVISGGIMPKRILDEDSYKKSITPGDLIVMCGGRVGLDGIHGVTDASREFDDKVSAQHVQIGDPYTQKKMHDFLLEARDRGYFTFITDNGGGGLSSSIGESSSFNFDPDAVRRTDGARVFMERIPLKYQGLDPWEIWVSESQERMTVAVKREHIDDFIALSRIHDVESTVIGEYNDTGKLHITDNGKTVACMDNEFFEKAFPQWEFEAEWTSPLERKLREPRLKPVTDHDATLKKFLGTMNNASQEWLSRQYDHEVQGGKVLGPLTGVSEDMASDAVVFRPVLESRKGLVATQALNQTYSFIDAWSMAASSIDEAVRNALVVGGKLDKITGMDNFCCPSIEYDALNNPDGKFKAAQLVRANKALRDLCNAYEIPLLSGKDSMYMDGTVRDRKAKKFQRISAPEQMLFTVHTLIDDVREHITPFAKTPGNLVYVLGTTKDELGGSEYYHMLGKVGANAPVVDAEENLRTYRGFEKARDKGYIVSAKNVKSGGLAMALFQMAGGGNAGMRINLDKVRTDRRYRRDDKVLYSESAGRMIVEIRPHERAAFEEIMGDIASCIGTISDDTEFVINGLSKNNIIRQDIYDLKNAWKEPFREWGYNIPWFDHKQKKAA